MFAGHTQEGFELLQLPNYAHSTQTPQASSHHHRLLSIELTTCQIESINTTCA